MNVFYVNDSSVARNVNFREHD